MCFRALIFFALAEKKKKKNLYFLLVSGSIKVLEVKLLSCNTNCERERQMWIVKSVLERQGWESARAQGHRQFPPHLCWQLLAKGPH